jgi:hypothetical protein
MGRLLIIPVALSGVCLSMLFGVPMAGAMTIDQTVMSMDIPDDHGMNVVENQDQGSQPACYAVVRMEHETEATTPDQGKTSVVSFVADIPREAAVWKLEGTASVWIPPNPLSPHQPFSLTGIIFKRE